MAGYTKAEIISIHALLAESDNCFKCSLGNPRKFLSTLSLRRATDWPPVRDVIQWISIHALLAESDRDGQPQPRIARTISIHALLAESDPAPVPCGPHADISIHALLAESDHMCLLPVTKPAQFLSTLSLRRATGDGPHY